MDGKDDAFAFGVKKAIPKPRRRPAAGVMSALTTTKAIRKYDAKLIARIVVVFMASMAEVGGPSSSDEF